MNPELCGYAIVDSDGEQQPCNRPATGWRWYQDCDHEDVLDVACDLHANEGGRRMHAAEAEVARLRAGEADDPGDPFAWPTPEQWIRRFNDKAAEQRIEWARRVIENSHIASECFMSHEPATRLSLPTEGATHE